MTRTIPTKEQVLQAASKCPQTKEALEILFPEDFKEEKPKWPEGYEEFGAFILGANLYIRKELMERLYILREKSYSSTILTPDGFIVAPYGYRTGSMFPDFRKIPSWIKTKDFGKV